MLKKININTKYPMSKKIKLGSLVAWITDPEDKGYVVDKSGSALFIRWDNGDKDWIDIRFVRLVKKVN